MKYIHRLIFILLLVTGCKKAVEVAPPASEITSETVYTSNASAAAVLTSIYEQMSRNGSGFASGASSITISEGLQADELANYSNNQVLTLFYHNDLSADNNYFWQELYQYIYIANAAIAGLSSSSGVTPSMQKQLVGEAKFLRAYLYFYAVNLFGPVPLTLTTDYQTNNTISRTPAANIYTQIVNDLTAADTLLGDSYLDANNATTSEKTRPNKEAANALLARTYLYTKDWIDAEAKATEIITSTAAYSLDTLNGVYLKNSSEAIWQLEPVATGFNTFDAYIFILLGAPGNSTWPVAVSTNLLNAFEPNDQRRADWIDSLSTGGNTFYFPYKYKAGSLSDVQVATPVTEYLMMLRLGEQYLIRAEARAQQGNMIGASGAISDLNTIRERAQLPDYAGPTDQTSVLNAIYHEEQVEMFCEWGHRWFDLVRTGNVNTTMGAPGNITVEKGGNNWSTDWELLPIPHSEISVNPNLTQNQGY